MTRRFAIIGSGMAGLTAAETLHRRGVGVTIFEKSPRQGGRIASRHTQAGVFNHGAARIETASPEFAAFLEGLGAQREQDGVFCGAPYMRALFDPLTARLSIKWKVTVASMERIGENWFVHSEGGARHGPFAGVIVTAPAPQAARLIDGASPDVSDRLAGIEMESTWTGMLAFDRPIRLPASVAGGECLASKLEDDGSAAGWVVHMGVDWSEDHLETDSPFVAALLLEEVERELGERLPATSFLAAHRWRFARARRPVGAPFVADEARRLWSGGDWALGRRAEDAWSSGRAMAKRALAAAGVD